MNIIEELKNHGFKQVESEGLNSLKRFEGPVNHLNEFDDEYSNDFRFSINASEEINGLHISANNHNESQINQNFYDEVIRQSKDSLEILFLLSYQLELSLTNFPKLTYLNVSQSPELTTLHIDNAPKLKEIHASLCPKLIEVTLGAELNELEKLDISKSPVETFETGSQLQNLAYFIAFETKFKQLNLAHMSRIKYLIAQNSEISEIDWTNVDSLPNLESLELPADYTSDINRITEILKQHGGLKLREELNTYLKILADSETQSQKRLKILLLGNTTSGKSTLRRILFSNEGEEIKDAKEEEKDKEKSTHGAIIKTETLKLNQEDYQVQVFDFGGQDYYHATHLPFYQAHTWHILIYGPDEGTQLESAYEYGKKVVESRDEVLFPITYWLKSVANYGNATFYDEPLTSGGSKVNLVQNIKNGSVTPWELDRLSLKKTENLDVGEFKEYDFLNHAVALKKWVLEKITIHAREEKMLKPSLDLHQKIKASRDILLTIKQVQEMTSAKSRVNTIDYLKELHANHLGYFFQLKEDSSGSENTSTKLNNEKFFFIQDLTQFSQWIHQILSKELISKTGQHGYFDKEEALGRLESDEARANLDHIITFLEEEQVIFPVKGKDNEWIAPSYLPEPKLEVEKLLLESFDEPDVKIFLPDFFHTNLIHVLIKEFKDSLVQDPQKKTYLLWKNKILLYEEDNHVSNELSKQKAFLLLELIYPMDAVYESYKIDNPGHDCPVLVIRRNQSGFVAESIFAKIYQYINKHFTDKNITKEIWLKSKLGDYIPMECLKQDNKNTYSERVHSVYYKETFYPMRDFQYFIQEGYKLPTKVFIAYSKANADLLDEFILHLQPYRNRGELDFFYDKELRMGDKWDEAIKKELLTCDVLVCLITPHLLNTHYVTHLELPLAVDKKKKIVPLILEECDWTSLPIRDGNENLLENLGVNNALDKGIPISSDRADRQAKWKEVALKLKDLR